MLTMDLKCEYDSFVTARAVMELQISNTIGGQTASYSAVLFYVQWEVVYVQAEAKDYLARFLSVGF